MRAGSDRWRDDTGDRRPVASRSDDRTEPRRRFLILHGWQNHRPVGHWQRWLAERLTAAGHDVCYPQLPDPEFPILKDWLAATEQALARAPGVEQAVVAHSLSCVTWLHLARQGSVHLPVGRVLLVAPPGPRFLAETAELRGFQLPPDALDVIHSGSLAVPRLVCADNDRYCQPPADAVYGRLCDVDRVNGAGHLDMAAGYGRWLSALRWCEDATYRLNAE
ncbi:hydrolase [Plantactinospora sp. BB1]|nr:hydrolase [Plantactinospora sp. BB1]